MERELQATRARLLTEEGRAARTADDLRRLLDSKTVRFAQLLQQLRHRPWRLPLLPLQVLALALPDSARRRVQSARTTVGRILHPPPTRDVVREAWPAGRPLVSVVIPCFNYGAYVTEAVDSVLAQTLHDLEVHVVDGGSDELTLQVLRSLHRPRTTVHFREGRHLVGDNRNYGIERSLGKYVCCLDADDLLLPTYLEKAIFLAEAGGFDLVYPSVQCFGDDDDEWLVGDVTFEQCLAENGVPTVALFRRDAWQAVGGYRDWGLGADLVHEDWDLWVRMIGSGSRPKGIRETLMLYRVHGHGLTSSASKSLAEHAAAIRAANQDLLAPTRLRRMRQEARVEVRVASPRVNLARVQPAGGDYVLFAVPFTVVGGADTVLTQIAAGLRDDGFRVGLATTLEPLPNMGDGSARWQNLTDDVFQLPRFLPQGPLRREFFLHLLESRRAGVLLLTGSEFAYDLLPEIKARFPHVRVVDQLFNEFGHLARNRRYRACIDLHIVATEDLGRILVERHGEDPAKVRVIRHGVDAENEFHPDEIEPAPLDDIAPQLAGKMIAAFAGRLSEEKDPLLFLEVARRFLSRKDVGFLMVGDGPLSPLVRARADGDLAGSVFWTPFVRDVRPLLRCADVLVLPSRIEGIPIVMLEALALRVPVIASRVGGIPTVLEDGRNGFLCAPGDLDDFTRRLAWVADHPDDRKRMGTYARQRVEQDFGLGRMSRDYVDALRSVLGAPPVA